MNYYKKLTGDKVYLSPINVDDYEKYTEWLSDLDITINLSSHSKIISKYQEKESLEKLCADNNNFSIIDKENDKLLGNCGFFNVDSTHRRAEVGIFIGEKDYWGKGFGRDALELLLDFGFNLRNLNSIMLSVRGYNHRAIKCYEKVGFKRIGIRREACIFGEKKYDVIFMDILASEFESKFFKKFLEEKDII